MPIDSELLHALGEVQGNLGNTERLARIGDTLRTLFAEAETEGVTPAEAADRMVRRRLAAGRSPQ